MLRRSKVCKGLFFGVVFSSVPWVVLTSRGWVNVTGCRTCGYKMGWITQGILVPTVPMASVVELGCPTVFRELLMAAVERLCVCSGGRRVSHIRQTAALEEAALDGRYTRSTCSPGCLWSGFAVSLVPNQQKRPALVAPCACVQDGNIYRLWNRGWSQMQVLEGHLSQ